MRLDPNCERCEDVETMEHLLCECMHYSQLIWIRLGEIIIKYLNSQEFIPRVELSQLTLILHVPDKRTTHPYRERIRSVIGIE
jgi:hypothetical protein